MTRQATTDDDPAGAGPKRATLTTRVDRLDDAVRRLGEDLPGQLPRDVADRVAEALAALLPGMADRIAARVRDQVLEALPPSAPAPAPAVAPAPKPPGLPARLRARLESSARQVRDRIGGVGRGVFLLVQLVRQRVREVRAWLRATRAQQGRALVGIGVGLGLALVANLVGPGGPAGLVGLAAAVLAWLLAERAAWPRLAREPAHRLRAGLTPAPGATGGEGGGGPDAGPTPARPDAAVRPQAAPAG